MTRRRAIIAGFLAFVVALAASHFRSTPYDNYTLLGIALLHGHVWIDWPGPYIDALGFAGKHYVIEAPFPAVLMMPLLWLFGTAANQTFLAVVLCGVGVGAAWELGERLGVPAKTNAWLCAFLLAGTDLLWCAMLGDVWFIAHVAAVCFTLLALVELRGKRRGWLVALWMVCAIESRFALVLALLPIAYLLALNEGTAARIDLRLARTRVLSFAAVLAAAAGLWVWYNLARWGVASDIGYTQWYHQDQAGMPTGSPFRLMYLPYELWSFFVQYPGFSAQWPWIRPSISGVALTWTSPALILALFVRRWDAFVVAMWVAAVLVAAPSFLYYVNGFAQYGMRHALDFVPFLFALMAIAARTRLVLWQKVLIAYSCAAGLYGVWFWDAFIRPGN